MNDSHEVVGLAGLTSVVTPARNSAATIARAVDSVASQSVQPLEHIVVDDGSDDGTGEVLKELSARYPHLKCLRQKNQGAASARNAGIESARGRYIAFLDSDDYWLDRKLERQLRFMEESAVLFSYGDYLEVDTESGKEVGVQRPPSVLSHRDLLDGCPIGCLTAAYNQIALGKVYMPSVRRGQDWGLWLALTRGGRIARKYPGLEAIYSVGSGTLSSGKLRKAVDVYTIYRNEEDFGRMRSLWHLGRHVGSALRKRHALA